MRLGFDPRPVHVWFTVDKPALAQAFLHMLGFSSVIPIILRTHIWSIYHWHYIILAKAGTCKKYSVKFSWTEHLAGQRAFFTLLHSASLGITQVLVCVLTQFFNKQIVITCICSTGHFIMFSMITNIYNKKTKGPNLMEFFIATGKLKKFFLTTRDVQCVHHRWHGTHQYDIHVETCVARTWISYW